MSGENRSNPDTPAEAESAGPEKGRRKGATPTPHDALFRAVLSDPVQVQSLLRDHLPNEIAGKLADTPPRILDGTFVDESLRGSQSDLLVQVELASGVPGFVYLLGEHKSYSDPGVVLQMAEYMIRIWRRYARDRVERLRNLPPIIPMVLYSGADRWTVPDGLAEMIASDDPELVFLPGERFILRWLARMDPHELSSDPLLQAGFVTLTRRALEFLKPVDEALTGNPALQKQFIEYILLTYTDVRFDDLTENLNAIGADEMERVMGTIAETLEAKGRAEGEARGLAKGRKQDLIRLLERRFGPLPRAARERIAKADLDQLDSWIDRVLDAKNLDAVFGDG